jgi:hypothetical protein
VHSRVIWYALLVLSLSRKLQAVNLQQYLEAVDRNYVANIGS